MQPQSYIAIDNFYTGTVYEKGAEVIGMLKTLVGDEGYRKATDLYFERHDGEAATVEDWVKCSRIRRARPETVPAVVRTIGNARLEATGNYDSRKENICSDAQAASRSDARPAPEETNAYTGASRHAGQRTGRALKLTLEGENATGPEERVLELTGRGTAICVRGYSRTAAHIDRPAFLGACDLQDKPRQKRSRGADGARSGRFQSLGSGQILRARSAARNGAGRAFGRKRRRPTQSLSTQSAKCSHAPRTTALLRPICSIPPLESELALVMDPVDPEALHAARTNFIRAVAAAHKPRASAIVSSRSRDNDAYTPGSGIRRPARAPQCLLALPHFAPTMRMRQSCADAHYRAASNMSDMMAGLAQLARMDSQMRDAAFANFHDRFRNDALVLDKWLALQATSPLPGAANGVRALMHHPFFDIKNPNRVRALVGAFAGNHLRFHAGDGEGYKLVGEVLRMLDGINAQVAARMAGAFETWRRYDTNRQALMRAELKSLLAMPNRSSNMFEVATKMLG